MVIGEVGGSSSRWALLHEAQQGVVLPVKGRPILGFNPLNGDARSFTTDLREAAGLYAAPMLQAAEVVVYGAGCGTEARRAVMREALAALWPLARIQVETDLLGAARGLAGSKPALIVILGTGMNAGAYDGNQLSTPMPSLGWVLGDEASGADIGRCLLQDAFHRRIPEDLHVALFGLHGPPIADVLEQVYRSLFPARAMAAYTVRLAEWIDAPYVRELLRGRFHALADLLTGYFTPDQRRTVHATGSVAYGFRELLAECLLERGMTLTVVEPDPLPGLVHYHRAP